MGSYTTECNIGHNTHSSSFLMKVLFKITNFKSSKNFVPKYLPYRWRSYHVFLTSAMSTLFRKLVPFASLLRFTMKIRMNFCLSDSGGLA